MAFVPFSIRDSHRQGTCRVTLRQNKKYFQTPKFNRKKEPLVRGGHKRGIDNGVSDSSYRRGCTLRANVSLTGWAPHRESPLSACCDIGGTFDLNRFRVTEGSFTHTRWNSVIMLNYVCIVQFGYGVIIRAGLLICLQNHFVGEVKSPLKWRPPSETTWSTSNVACVLPLA